MKFLMILSFAFSSIVHADTDCNEEYWTLKGGVKKEVDRFDGFMKTLAASKNPIADLNQFLAKHGLPQRLGISAEEKMSYPNRVEGEEDSPGGPVALLFLKTMVVKPSSGVVFDTVYEVDSLDAAKAARTWPLPRDSTPDAINGDEVIIADTISSICGKETRAVGVAIKPDGTYRVIEHKTKKDGKQISADKCKAGKNLFEDSSYQYCAEFTDEKTKKKRILIWEIPMT